MSEIGVFLALDLGTTTLGGCLLDPTGTVLAEGKLPNPQAELGADVVRRLEAARDGQGQRLQALLVEGIESLIAELCARASVSRKEIGAAAAAANPAVCTLLRALDPAPILFPPHRPRVLSGVLLPAGDLGLTLPVGLYLFPLVSGYVGGDLVAFLYGFESVEPCSLFVDVGTNGEMAFYDGQRWWTTSVAAGPAFEGGEISCGMAAEPGAVSGVRLAGERLELEVIGSTSPRGLCGSGLAEAVAAGLEGGLIDSSGRIVDPLEVETNLARCIVDTAGGRGLRLYRDAVCDLVLTQEDIRGFQLGKAAVRAGVECLLQRAGVEMQQVRTVWVTGAFGFSLTAAALKRVAMLPPNMVNKLSFRPGGALKGVQRMLLQTDGAAQVENFSSQLKPYPLSGTPAFEQAFIKSLDF